MSDVNLLFIAFTVSFSFSKLDPSDPNRLFSFDLAADDTYNITYCDPPLDTSVMDKLLRDLDDTDDMIPMVQGMRRGFLDWLERNESSCST